MNSGIVSFLLLFVLSYGNNRFPSVNHQTMRVLLHAERINLDGQFCCAGKRLRD